MRYKKFKLVFYVLILSSIGFVSVSSAKKPIYVGNIAKEVNPFLPLMPRKADLKSIRGYGYLRVLHLEKTVTAFEAKLLKNFAESNHIKVIYIAVKSLNRGHKLLKLGLADILLGDNNLSEGLSKTLPIKTKNNHSTFWTVRSENKLLNHSINHLLNNVQITENLPENYQEDLPGLKKRKLLRIATDSDPQNFFLKNGSPAGFEYELLQKFAKEQGLWLEVLIAKNDKEKLAWVADGKADIAITRSRVMDHKLESSFPFYPAENFIVTKKSSTKFDDYHDLHGQRIAIRSAGTPTKQIDILSQKGLKFSLLELDKNTSFSEFLQLISDREFQYGIVSAKNFIKAKQFHDQLKVVMADNKTLLHIWAVNKDNKQLQLATSEFLREEFESKFYNIVYNRYFPDQKKQIDDSSPDLKISPYDHLAKKYAEEYKFDWRLVLAQMYQESQFKPNAKSSAGAKGLMQIMPNTAKELRLKNVEDPEIGIKAGMKYMKKLRDRYTDDLSKSEQNWFTLASYNAGYERIEDARKFADKLGLDPNRWFDNVEHAMQELAKPQNRKQTRFGYCQCGQTVVYLRNIRKLYNSYIQLTDPLLASSYSLNLLTDNK